MKTCLVVDDSQVVRKVARMIFETLSFETSEAESGPAALDRCQEKMPDAIFLDSHMPIMGSVEFVSTLRTMADGRKPVVLYCVTENDPSDIARVLTAGADDYIVKPFTRETIREKLADCDLL
jgi:two-component system, chemotaxis family, chemotaxis protein CheY